MYNQGDSPETIAADYAPHLPIAGVYAALAYYLANKAQLDAELEADERAADEDMAYYRQHGRLPPKYG